MGKRRIALCITDLDVGGAEQCLVALATRLDRERFEPVVYCLGPRPESAEASCVPALEAAAVPIHCLGARGVRDALGALRGLHRLLASQQPDLIQTFLFHANLLGRIAARRAGVPHVVCGLRVAERHSRWHLWLDRLTQRLVDRYVCVSKSVADFSHNEGGLPSEKLWVIPNGIDVQKYPAPSAADFASLGVASGRRVVTYVGRLEPQKGLSWLLETASGWLNRLPDCDLVLVGKGPDRQELEQGCQRLGLSSRVHFAGWRKDIREILAASSLLVLPSRWEGMPNVVLQAMASGLPVLATDVEGVRELLGPQADAQTVPYGDTEAWTARILELLADPECAAQLGRKNRLRAEQEFSLDRMVNAYQDLWTSLICGGRRAAPAG